MTDFHGNQISNIDVICLVVVDDNQILRLIGKILKDHADKLFLTDNQQEAERILEDFSVTHIICDFDLGNKSPDGIQLIRKWRRRYSSIERAIILTGEGPGETDSLEVSIYHKPITHADFLDALGIAHDVQRFPSYMESNYMK